MHADLGDLQPELAARQAETLRCRCRSDPRGIGRTTCGATSPSNSLKPHCVSCTPGTASERIHKLPARPSSTRNGDCGGVTLEVADRARAGRHLGAAVERAHQRLELLDRRGQIGVHDQDALRRASRPRRRAAPRPCRGFAAARRGEPRRRRASGCSAARSVGVSSREPSSATTISQRSPRPFRYCDGAIERALDTRSLRCTQESRRTDGAARLRARSSAFSRRARSPARGCANLPTTTRCDKRPRSQRNRATVNTHVLMGRAFEKLQRSYWRSADETRFAWQTRNPVLGAARGARWPGAWSCARASGCSRSAAAKAANLHHLRAAGAHPLRRRLLGAPRPRSRAAPPTRTRATRRRHAPAVRRRHLRRRAHPRRPAPHRRRRRRARRGAPRAARRRAADPDRAQPRARRSSSCRRR